MELNHEPLGDTYASSALISPHKSEIAVPSLAVDIHTYIRIYIYLIFVEENSSSRVKLIFFFKLYTVDGIKI